MPHDIFISYSRKDSEHALSLAERLEGEGIRVWIDKQGIVGAEKWATEIVEGIKSCSTFILLISGDSVKSENVLRELSLANESRKRILPVEIERIELPTSFMYPLAGLQRVKIADFGGIVRAHKHGVERIVQKDLRKTLMILPFEDLSPTHDNEWFADGIASELIGTLSNVKALRICDAQATKEFKQYKGQLSVYAKEMNIRYFVQGDVRKFGDQIKISSRLIDIETGDHMWQDSMKGTMENIFDFQEEVALKVVEGLNVILTKEEENTLDKKPTENAEAYELYLKGDEYYSRSTRDDYERALQIYREAVRLDPGFAEAHLAIASTSLSYYRFYSRDEKWITDANEHITKAESVSGTPKKVNQIRSLLARSLLARILGKYEEALHLAEYAVALDPEFAPAHDSLGSAYQHLGRLKEAADAFERNVQLRENDRGAQFGYIIAVNELNDVPRLREAARKALSIYERHLRLTPDDLNARVQYANILGAAGEHDQALLHSRKLEEEALDGFALYNLACGYLHEGENESALRVLRKSIERGHINIDIFRRDPDLDPLRSMQEFEEIMMELEKKLEVETKANV
jgi:TolB-like protein/Flp pilus assembly protein TadD